MNRLAAAACMVLLASTAWAGDVPSSAWAQALSIDPILLDSSFLVFQFPQMAVSRDSAALGLAHPVQESALLVSTNGNEYGLGAVLHGKRTGAFVLSQASQLPYSSGSSFTGVLSAALAQLGGGVAWGDWRLGATLRGSRAGRTAVTSQGSSRYPDDALEQRAAQYLEGAAGVGWSRNGADLEAAFEWTHTAVQSEGLRLTSSDTVAARVRSIDPHDAHNIVGRVSIPCSEALSLVAAGNYQWGQLHYSQEIFSQQGIQATEHGPEQRDWSARLAVLVGVPGLDCVGLTGGFEHLDYSFIDAGRNGQVSQARRRADVSTLSVASTKSFGRSRRLVAGAAIGVTYDRENIDQLALYGTERSSEQTQRSESFRHSFHCGVGWSWRQFELAGSLAVPPITTQPASVIDITLKF